MCNREDMLWRNDLKRHVIVSFSMALLVASCTLSAVAPTPVIPLTGDTPQPATPALPTPTGASASALFFDGQDDYILIDDDPSLDLQNSFTIAAWIYLESYTEWASIVTKGDKPNINNYALQQSGPDDPIYGTQFGTLRFSGCVGLSARLPESQTVFSLRTWHFVAITFDGLNVTFYLNGQQDGSFPVSGPLCTNDEPLYIGVDFPLTTEYWHGGIDELRIWNLALSETQIQDAMRRSVAPADALVGYWNFDEGSGTIVHDRSGQENHGYLIGDPLWTSPGAPIP